MNTYVCIAAVPDPEAAPPRRTIASDGRTLEPWSGTHTVGPFDGNALELALQLRERVGGSVTAVSVGGPESIAALRAAVAVNVDQVVWVEQGTSSLDPRAVAVLLGAAIRSRGGADLVLCGRQGGEWDSGQVGPLLAAELGVESVGFVRRIRDVDPEHISVEREVEEGLQLYGCDRPCVLLVTNDDGNQLRGAKVKDAMRARRETFVGTPPEALGIKSVGGSATPIVALRAIAPTPRSVIKIVGSGPEQVASLADVIVAGLGAAK